MPGTTVVPQFRRYPTSREQLVMLLNKLPAADIEVLLCKAQCLYAASLRNQSMGTPGPRSTRSPSSTSAPVVPVASDFPYPTLAEARPHMKNLVLAVTGKQTPSRATVAKDLWVSLGRCMGVVVGEPGVAEAATVQQLLAYVGEVDDDEGVALLEQAADNESPDKVEVELKSLNAADFLMGTKGASTGGRIARLLIPILLRWGKDLMEDKLGELTRRATT